MMLTDRKLLAHLDKMLEDGINGTFSESDYDETKLSKLESKWLRYLTSSKLSAQKTAQEREKLQELIDEEAAAVVRRIFQLCIEGNGPTVIANILTADGVPTPTAYYRSKGMSVCKQNVKTKRWGMATVIHILERMD